MKTKDTCIGKIGLIADKSGLTFEVKIIAYKRAFGNEQWCVEPVAGTGRRWVRSLTIKK